MTEAEKGRLAELSDVIRSSLEKVRVLRAEQDRLRTTAEAMFTPIRDAETAMADAWAEAESIVSGRPTEEP
jgi:hypothetical protein